jgi:dienelactone hydrolase
MKLALIALVALTTTGCSAARPPTRSEVTLTASPPSDPAQMPNFIGQNGKFSKPDGKGPFPAVVILHGCGGPGGHTYWIGLLKEWGYATYYIDSFTPRGQRSVCRAKGQEDKPQAIVSKDRVPDAYAALAYLRTRKDVIADKIGVVGFSHGGGVASWIARADQIEQFKIEKPFAASVAFYGGCRRGKFRLATDLLILYGEADDWGRVDVCKPMVAQQGKPTLDRLQLVLYPGAYHAFDVPGRPRESFGHHLEFNEPAALDAQARTKAYFDARLKS